MKKQEKENKFRIKLSFAEIAQNEIVENIKLFEMGEITSTKEGIERIFNDLMFAFGYYLREELDYILFPPKEKEEGEKDGN